MPSGWPRTCYVAPADFELETILAQPPEHWGPQSHTQFGESDFALAFETGSAAQSGLTP